MSYHIYVSKEGFKDTPITNEQWVAAAAKCEELYVEERKMRSRKHLFVSLKTDKQQHISLTPHGLVHAQDPSKDLVSVMFKLATLLDAKVYSEELAPYKSIEDWENKTEKFRTELRNRRRENKIASYKRKFLWFIWIIIAALVGIFLALP